MDNMNATGQGLDLRPTFGAMFIGVLFATFFQGILTLQAFIYYERFEDDPKYLKILVAGIWVLDVAHLVLISQATYHYLVSNWGNPSALQLTTTSLDLHLLFVGLATICCQGFFLRRIWVFSKGNIYIVGFLSLGCVAPLVLDWITSFHIINDPVIAHFPSFTKEVVALFAIGAGVDIIMALLLVYYLSREKSEVRRTSSVIATLIQYTVATGLATSLLAIGSLIAYFARPNTLIYIGIHFSLGRMYTNALLATLNSRQSLREKINSNVEFHRSTGWNSIGARRRRADGPPSIDGLEPDEVNHDSDSHYALRKMPSNSLRPIGEGVSIHIETDHA